jgi:hypothetical protein
MRVGLFIVLSVGAAYADVDPVEQMAEQQAAASAPDSGRVGAFFHGAGKKTDFTVMLEQGKCYFFSGAGGDGVKKLSLYLWGPPRNERLSDNRARSPLSSMMYCATVTGMYKFQAKIEGGDGAMVVGLYARGAPKQALPQVAPRPVAAAPAAAAPEAPCVDDGEEGPAQASFSCEGKAIDVTLDGEFLQHQPGEMPIVRDVAPGCHRVKVDCWTGIFKHGVVYNGNVKFAAGYQSRFNGRPGALDLVGKSKLAPPPPAAPQVSREQLDDAREYLKDAIDVNRDLDSRCQGRISGKLESIRDLLRDFERGEVDLDRVLRKVGDTRSMVREECGSRAGESIDRKLSKVERALGGR